jgi:hypothetical protein
MRVYQFRHVGTADSFFAALYCNEARIIAAGRTLCKGLI